MKKIIIFYDSFCPNCSKFVEFIQNFNYLNLIEIKQLRKELDTNLFPDINLELAKQQMASFGTKWHYGYNSIYFIFLRLPAFWVFLPFLYILKITTFGQMMYIELALKRKIIPIHCDAKKCNSISSKLI
jgi:predicted DCC family thiol-disulfide oxidoreductase YuxK